MLLRKTLTGPIFRYLVLSASFVVMLTGCNLPSTSVAGVPTPEISGVPIVRFASPVPNSTYLRDVTVNVLLRVSNAGDDIDRVEISVDGAQIATLPQPNPLNAAEFSVTQTFTPANSGRIEVSATAFRSDGTSSVEASVLVNVIDELPGATEEATETPQATPTILVSPTTAIPATLASTNTSAPLSPTPALTATASVPMVTSQGVNVRRGPSTNFEPPLGVLGPSMNVEALALNLAGDWIKIRFNNGEGWVFRELTQVTGDLSGLPRESGPPIPTLPPATNTSVPAATNTPGVSTNGANLVINGFELIPRDPFCNQAAVARVNVANVGNAASGAGTRVVFISVDNADGTSDFLSRDANIPSIEAGANFLVEISFTDSSGGGKFKRAVAVVDPDNQIPETNDNDNTSESIVYALGVPPDC